MIGSFLVFSLPRSACSNTISVDGVTSASRLLLSVIIYDTNVGEAQTADANITLLCCVCYMCPVYLHSHGKARQPLQIDPSVSLYSSICLFHIFVYVVGTLPKTACGCMHVHMAAAIVEVPLYTARFLKRCCFKFHPRRKRGGISLILFLGSGSMTVIRQELDPGSKTVL